MKNNKRNLLNESKINKNLTTQRKEEKQFHYHVPH